MRDESESLIPEAELDAEGRAGEQSSPKAADFDKMLRRGADAGTLWPTGYGPQSVPQVRNETASAVPRCLLQARPRGCSCHMWAPHLGPGFSNISVDHRLACRHV